MSSTEANGRVWQLKEARKRPTKRVSECFRFFDLPLELRFKILSFLIESADVIDLQPENYHSARQRMKMYLVSHRMYTEASQIFFSQHTFRIFPTHGRFFGNKSVPSKSTLHESYGNRNVPLISRLSVREQGLLTSLELRLGPGWGGPPKTWRVSDTLGLQNMHNVRLLIVFVEVDPSQDLFKGFRASKDFYTNFSQTLFKDILDTLPCLDRIEIDGRPSVVARGGNLVKTLVSQATSSGRFHVRLLLNDTATASPQRCEQQLQRTTKNLSDLCIEA